MRMGRDDSCDSPGAAQATASAVQRGTETSLSLSLHWYQSISVAVVSVFCICSNVYFGSLCILDNLYFF